MKLGWLAQQRKSSASCLSLLRQSSGKGLKALTSEPKPKQSRKLRGAEKAYRLRIRDYRVVYTVGDKERLVIVMAVKHRKETYRG